MNDIDERLQRAGERWRATEAAPPVIDPTAFLAPAPRRTAPWYGLAAAALAAVAILVVWRSMPTQPSNPADGQGMLHLTAKDNWSPNDAPLDIRFLFPDGTIAAGPDSLAAQTSVSLDLPLPVGSLRLVMGAETCTGTLEVEAGVELDAVIEYPNPECRITIAATHPIGSIQHAEPFTGIGVFVPVDSTLVIRPIDAPGQAGEIRKPADNRGEVEPVQVQPGRYELVVFVDGVQLNSMTIDIGRGQAYYYNLRILPPDVPRDCGEYAEAECEAIITEAYASGLFLESGQRARSVQVRPTKYGGCDSNLDNKWDVTFDIAPVGPVEVTVGVHKNGSLHVCTY